MYRHRVVALPRTFKNVPRKFLAPRVSLITYHVPALPLNGVFDDDDDDDDDDDGRYC